MTHSSVFLLRLIQTIYKFGVNFTFKPLKLLFAPPHRSQRLLHHVRLLAAAGIASDVEILLISLLVASQSRICYLPAVSKVTSYFVGAPPIVGQCKPAIYSTMEIAPLLPVLMVVST